jgi:Clustered mitochondria
MGVQVDLEDEVAPGDSDTVPHTGCLEIKVLKGTDGRAYTLEAMRITPRDANYVKVRNNSCQIVLLGGIAVVSLTLS